jgi:hypothetical protein
MENKKHNTDIFEMVNNHERQKAIRKKYSKIRKKENIRILHFSVICGIASLFFGLMGITGLMNIWIASPIFSALSILTAFLAGRWFENGRCLGWK